MTIVLNGNFHSIEPILLSRLPQIKRTQQNLMFLISVMLIVCCISFMSTIYSLSVKYQTDISELIIILCWILFFACGMFITEGYDYYSLLVFAWLGIINIIFTCTMIVYETIRIVILTSEESQKMIGAHVIIIPVYTCLIGIILQALIVILAFKLSYLILKNQKSTDHQQI